MKFEDVIDIVQDEFKKTVPQVVDEAGVTLNQYNIRAIEHNLHDHLLAKKMEINSIIEEKDVDQHLISNNVKELISFAVIQAKKRQSK